MKQRLASKEDLNDFFSNLKSGIPYEQQVNLVKGTYARSWESYCKLKNINNQKHWKRRNLRTE